MKKILAATLCLIMSGSLLAGCTGNTAPEEVTSDTSLYSTSEITTTTTSETSASTTTTEETTTETTKERWFTFQPKVTSSFIKEVYGQDKIDAWYSLVDAVMAGEDTFECKDSHTYFWTISDFPNRCFPVLEKIVGTVGDPPNVEVNGTAKFKYKVPKEEAKKMIDDFIVLVEDIINEVIKPEYNDFEKALALYSYFARTYTYDYDTFNLIESDPAKANYTCPYRLMTGKTGVCAEISEAYSFLLTQVGVEASVVIGGEHEWSIIKIGDNYYHIDPTFELNSWDDLQYFMMTDKQRFDQYPVEKDDRHYVGMYSPEKDPDYSAKDDSFKKMWNATLVSFDPETKILKYVIRDDNGNDSYGEFNYSIYN